MKFDHTHIIIVVDGKRVAPIFLEPTKNYHDEILMKAYNTLKTDIVKSHYENELGGTITLSIQNHKIYIECAGLSEKTTLFLTSLFDMKS